MFITETSFSVHGHLKHSESTECITFTQIILNILFKTVFKNLIF